MNFFGVGLPEMIVIGAVALLIFGPKRLPEIGRSVAKTIKSVQDASKEFEAELKREAATLESAVKAPATSPALAETASPDGTEMEASHAAAAVETPEAEPTVVTASESTQAEATA
ncbi:MAG: TatA/E family twin arginine-targeting protein translocase [Cyanobacteria bacterium J06648_11]